MEKYNVDGLYGNFHKQRLGVHCYPSEFLIRTMLGKKPGLNISHDYEGKKVLDWACGDGRNFPLLHNCGLELYGFEITQCICDGVQERMKKFGIDVDLRVGRNRCVPYENEQFDYVVASASIYYIDKDSSWRENVNELNRVLKRGGYAILTLVHPETFMLLNSEEVEEGVYRCVNDPYGLRNGDLFRAFSSKEEIVNEFSDNFENICIGSQEDDYYGEIIKLWLVVMQKK